MSISQFRIIICLSTGLLLAGCDGDGIAMGEGADVKDRIRQSFVDPSSVRFGDFGRCPSEKGMWRGDVDAKNRMGAYTGSQPFFYKDGVLTNVEDRRFTKVMNACYGSTEQVWSAAETNNPIDDTKTVSVTGDSDVDLTTGTENQISLTVRCQSGKTEMWVNWVDYLGDDSSDVYSDWKRVTVRVGKAPAEAQRWGLSTDNNATFSPGSPTELIRKMINADQVVFQTTPYNEGPVTAVFKMAGFAKAVEPVAKQCGWSQAN
jgi:hypothetical protein